MANEVDRETQIVERLQVIARQSRELIRLHNDLLKEYERLKDELDKIRLSNRKSASSSQDSMHSLNHYFRHQRE